MCIFVESSVLTNKYNAIQRVQKSQVGIPIRNSSEANPKLNKNQILQCVKNFYLLNCDHINLRMNIHSQLV